MEDFVKHSHHGLVLGEWVLQHLLQKQLPVVLLVNGEQPLTWVELKPVLDVGYGDDVQLLHFRVYVIFA